MSVESLSCTPSAGIRTKERLSAAGLVDVSLTTPLYALELMASVKLSWQDALIVEAGGTTLWSEDMQHGLVVQDLMIIRNPFADHV